MAITASEARKNLFPLIDQVNHEQEPVEIVSRRGSAYLVSEDQFRSMQETAYLLRSPVNAERLLRSIAQVESGGASPRDLLDPDAPAAPPSSGDVVDDLTDKIEELVRSSLDGIMAREQARIDRFALRELVADYVEQRQAEEPGE